MTPQDILSWLESKNTFGASLTPSDVAQFSSELQGKLNGLSVGAPGSGSSPVTLLYSGKLGVGDGAVDAWKVAEQIGSSSGGKVVTIGQTEVGSFMNSQAFNEALKDAVGGDSNAFKQILNGFTEADGTKVNGLWDIASNRFSAAAIGDVRTITPLSDPGSVFARTELRALLESPTVKSINQLKGSETFSLLG